jgi:hypothetical protein
VASAALLRRKEQYEKFLVADLATEVTKLRKELADMQADAIAASTFVCV